MTSGFKYALLAGAGTLAILAPGVAMAQTAEPQVQAPAGSTTVDDIIVTAQRRDQSLSKTPVAVSVVSSETLAEAQITSQQDLRSVTPGLSIRAAVNSNQLNYAVRGQSQDPLSDTTPGVVPYINEVQVGGTAGAAAFYDLASVQVLKGPQGTLFGRSATGGAVLFTTAKPSSEFGGFISGTGGDYDFRKVEGAINLPMGDQAMFRLAGIYQSRDGFQTNLFDGGTEGDYERYGFRPSLTLNLGDKLHNTTVVDYLRTSGSSTVASISGLVPFTGMGPPFIPIQALYAGTATPTARATGIGTVQAFLPPAFAGLVPGFYDAAFGGTTGRPTGGITQELANQLARGPFTVNSDGNNAYNSTSTVVTNSTAYDLTPTAQIRNIFGYQHSKVFNASDSDGTPYFISQSSTRGEPLEGADETTEIVSNELQLVGTAFDDRLDYVTGFYFADQTSTRTTVSKFFGILLGGQRQVNEFELSSTTYAGYGQSTYKLNDSGLAATLGLRYTSEKVGKEILPGDSFRLAAPTAPPGFDYDQSETYNRVSWQVGLQDQISPSTLLYVVSRRAYKSGGFNGTVQPKVGGADVAGDSYKAEQVTDAELGAKFNGLLGNMPARLSVSAYYTWIEDSQRLAFTLAGSNPASLTVNVPKGTTYGVEVEGSFSPTEWLSIGGSANYTNASYGDEPVLVNGQSQRFDQVPDTPETSGSLYADLTFPAFGNVEFVAHGDVYYQDTTYTTPRSQNNAGAVIENYTLANFRVGLQNTSDGWSLLANMKNAFDETYYVGGLATGEIFQINTLIPGDPRTFTIEARKTF